MLKFIFKLIKKIVLSGFILYGFNILMSPLSITIPINLITLSIITLLGLSGLFGLIIVLMFAV